MSEHQCYEFLALARPLTAKQMAELRAISTRAEISPTRFWNEYQWGDLKADPAKLMERYFDAHLYFANWGTHRLMLRIPKTRVDLKLLGEYFAGRQEKRLTITNEHVFVDLRSDTEEPQYDEESQGTLVALSPLRAELIGGDLRSAYLAWLLSVQADDADDDAKEPKEKDGWLRRAIEELDLSLGTELLRVYRATKKPESAPTRRTVGELRVQAESQRAAREKAEAARAKRARAVAAAARQRRLAELARDVDGAWADLEKLVASSTYDEAVKLASDLRDLALGDPGDTAFASRFEALRKRQLRRRGFFDRWKRAERGQ